MSGRWDWDVKSSYTYHALKKCKRCGGEKLKPSGGRNPG